VLFVDEHVSFVQLQVQHSDRPSSAQVKNPILCRNLFQFVDNTLGQEQLAWLEGVLTRSKQNGERVLITGHIPPGMFGGCWGKASHEYEMLIGRFQETVVGQLFGHQHSGSFRLLREDGKYLGKPVSVAHVTPGFSTFKGGNPAFRLYELREAPTWRLAGFKQFFLQLSDYNYEARGMEPTGSLNWVLGYTAPSDLNMTDMSPTAWQQLRDRFDVDEKYKSMFHDLEGSGRPWQVCRNIVDRLSRQDFIDVFYGYSLRFRDQDHFLTSSAEQAKCLTGTCKSV